MTDVLIEPETSVLFISKLRTKYAHQIEELLEKSSKNGSGRTNLPLGVEERGMDKVHMMLNAMQGSSYVAPHKHPDPNCAESFTCLSGEARVLLFDEGGKLKESVLLKDSEPVVANVPPDTFHTVVALEPSVLYEEMVQPKGRVYDSKKDKIFANWAPSEKSEEAVSYLEKLRLL